MRWKTRPDLFGWFRIGSFVISLTHVTYLLITSLIIIGLNEQRWFTHFTTFGILEMRI